MGLFDFFKKKEDEVDRLDPLDLRLNAMKKGYMVDYELETWEVTAVNRYDWGSGDNTWEWQLETHNDTIFLELEPDDTDFWCVTRKKPFRKLDPSVIRQLKETNSPPEAITFEGVTYYPDETGGAYFHKDNAPQGREVFKWDYVDGSETMLLTIEQWGDDDYELAVGKVVNEYEFSNILPVV